MGKVVLKNITGYSGYKAGSDGSIYSFWKMGIPRVIDYSWKPRKLRPNIRGGVHLWVQLTSDTGEKKCLYVHTLVAEAFISKRPRGLHCSHKNGNPRDNRPSNLCWETPKENMSRTLEHGTRCHGQKHYRSKLSLSDVRKIRSLLLKNTVSQRKIAKQFGVSPTTICDLKKGKVYRNVA